jgi:glycine C-acetyltransferase
LWLAAVDGNDGILNFCANNYLGLSNHPRLVQAAHKALDTHGFGLSSVRFICGTQVWACIAAVCTPASACCA